MAGHGAELVVADASLFTGQAGNPRGLIFDAPVAALPADRAIALAGTGLQVDISFIADPAAMAASVVSLLHLLLLAICCII